MLSLGTECGKSRVLTWQDEEEIGAGVNEKVLPPDGREGRGRNFCNQETVEVVSNTQLVMD